MTSSFLCYLIFLVDCNMTCISCCDFLGARGVAVDDDSIVDEDDDY